MKNAIIVFIAVLSLSSRAQINSGSFAAHVDFQTVAMYNQAYNVAVSDIDGDGKLEVIVAFAGPVAVFQNTSTPGIINAGSFGGTTIDLLTSGASWQVQTADLDGDGKKDVITGRWDGTFPGFSVFRNTSTIGNITFGPEQNLFPTVNPRGVQLADVDGDGKIDVVFCDDIAGKVKILRNTSSAGSISFAPVPVSLTFGANLRKLAIGDLDGDGKEDIAVGYESVAKMALFQNTSVVGTISFTAKVDITIPGSAWDIAIADMDGDGHKDIVSPCRVFSPDQIVVTRNLMTTPGIISLSSFATPVGFSAGVTGCDPLGVAVGILDNDTKPDIVITNNVANNIGVFRNISTPGSFTSASLAARVDFAAGPAPDGVIIADIDGNGKNDIIVANTNGSSTGSFSVFRNTILPVGTSEYANESQIRIFPDPTAGSIELTGIEDVSSVFVYNILGRIIIEKENITGAFKIDLSNELSGIYIIKIMNQKGAFTQRVIKE
jgi:hypothetical protein